MMVTTGLTGLSYIFSILKQTNSSYSIIIYLSVMLLLFIHIPFSIMLYRIDSERYHFVFKLIATSTLLLLVVSVLDALRAVVRAYNPELIQWHHLLYSLEDWGFVYLYVLIEKELKSEAYLKPEDRFRIGE